MCTKIKSTFKSRDEIHDISYHVWFPKGEVRGVVQISHGMCEYALRYSDFAKFLTECGYVVCANDHLGHGDSINSMDELGYFCENDGWQTVVADLHTLTMIMKKNYPDVPYFLFGHSMGSFMARAYCIKFGRELDGVILCGTSSGMDGMHRVISVISNYKRLRGDRYRSKIVNNLAFGAYNRKIENHRTPYDWVSSDEDVVDKYNIDEKCNFTFTINGFENLTSVLWYVNNDKWYTALRKDLPIYLIAGDADPVGHYGKGVRDVYKKLRAYQCDAKIKIYPDLRHELLNEKKNDEVYSDVLAFLNKHVSSYKQI